MKPNMAAAQREGRPKARLSTSHAAHTCSDDARGINEAAKRSVTRMSDIRSDQKEEMSLTDTPIKEAVIDNL